MVKIKDIIFNKKSYFKNKLFQYLYYEIYNILINIIFK